MSGAGLGALRPAYSHCVARLPNPLERERLWAALENVIAARGEATFLTAPILLPINTCFPDRWTPDEHGVKRLARRLLDYAGLTQLEVDVEMFTGETEVRQVGLDGRASATSHAGAAAWFGGIRNGRCQFGAETDQLDDPGGLVGAMAHEVSHAFRRTYHLEHRDRDVEEKLTDVTTIYLGFGVLTTAASARFITQHHQNLGSSYSHKRQGYLAGEAMAFMLGSQLLVRGYDAATIKWYAKHLPANQAAALRASVRESSRELVANGLGFERVPEASPLPERPLSWWRSLFR